MRLCRLTLAFAALLPACAAPAKPAAPSVPLPTPLTSPQAGLPEALRPFVLPVDPGVAPAGWGAHFLLRDQHGAADQASRPGPLREVVGGSFGDSPRWYGSESQLQGGVPRVPCVLVRADRTVPRDELERGARFEVGTELIAAVPVALTVAAALAPCHLAAREVLEQDARSAAAAFVPARPLPAYTEVTFRSDGLGGLSMPMRTYGPFVAESEAEPEPFASGMSYLVTLSNPLRTPLSASDLSVSPRARIVAAAVEGNRLRVRLSGKPGTRYTLHLPDGLEDVYGQPLAPSTREVRLPARDGDAGLYGPGGQRIVLAPGQRMPLDSVGVPELTVRVARVQRADAQRFAESQSAGQPFELPRGAQASVVSVARPWDNTRTELDVERLGVRGPGQFVVEVSARGVQRVRPLVFWVQRSALAIDVRVRAERLLARVTRSSDGGPVAGARVRLDDGAAATTRDDGWVELPLPAQPSATARWLDVRHGTDELAMPAVHYGSFSPDAAWLAVPQTSQRAYQAFSDRSVYAPGDTVVAKIIARELSSSAPLALPAGGPPLRYGVYLGGSQLSEGEAVFDAHGELDLSFVVPTQLRESSLSVDLWSPATPEQRTPVLGVSVSTGEAFLDGQLSLGGTHVAVGESVRARLVVKGLGERPMAGLPVDVSVEAEPGGFVVPAFPDFWVGGAEPGPPGAGRHTGVSALSQRATLQTGADGAAELELEAASLEQPVRHRAIVRAEARDPQGHSAVQRKVLIVDPADRYPALRRVGDVSPRQPWAMEVLGVDRAGRVTPGVKLRVSVRSAAERARELAHCELSSANAPVRCALPPLEPSHVSGRGGYVVQAEAWDAEGRRSTSEQRVSTSLPATAASPVPPDLDARASARDVYRQTEAEKLSVRLERAQGDAHAGVTARVYDQRGETVPGARLAWFAVDDEALELERLELPALASFPGPYTGERAEGLSKYEALPPPQWDRGFGFAMCGAMFAHDRQDVRRRARPLLAHGLDTVTDREGRAQLSFALPADAGAVVTVRASHGAAGFGAAWIHLPEHAVGCTLAAAFCP